MNALRLMTFNVKMRPWLADTLEGVSNDDTEQAKRVVEALYQIPNVERPHVIAFNEVFDEDGRSALVSALGNDWPHILNTIDPAFVGDEDAGLMLFSSIPLMPMAPGRNYAWQSYQVSADDDKWARKSVALVQIATPANPTTIAFTHLQASYEGATQYSSVRATQLYDVYRLIASVVGTDPVAWRHVIFVGDLNIHGQASSGLKEWKEVFGKEGTELTKRLFDGWHTYMHPPGKLPVDQGYTYSDTLNGPARLDYQCFGHPVDGGLVPHHMFQRIRNTSDHFSLESVVQHQSPHCTPSDAYPLLADAAIINGASPSAPTSLRRVQVDLPHPGSFHWTWIATPGTFTAWWRPDLEVRAFAESDLTFPLKPVDTRDAASLPPTTRGLLEGSPAYTSGPTRIDPIGSTFVSREPMLIACRSRSGATGAFPLYVLEHRGETPETAIWLAAHHRTPTSHPESWILGDDDRCWFKANLAETWGQVPRTEAFVIYNRTEAGLETVLSDAGLTAISTASGTQSTQELKRDTSGGETVLLSVKRAGSLATGASVEWTSPVRYLDLNDTLGVYVRNESGPDWPGDDEISLSIAVDGAGIFAGEWGSADTGEWWPALASGIQATVASRFPEATRVAFVRDLWFAYVETDFNAQGVNMQIEEASLPSGRPMARRIVTLRVPDLLSDGVYEFAYTVRRDP